MTSVPVDYSFFLTSIQVLFLIPKKPTADVGRQFLQAVSGVRFHFVFNATLSTDPSARDLLKHKFVRMAKKTSYLTELIERHERWRADGGGRIDDEEQDMVPDLYV